MVLEQQLGTSTGVIVNTAITKKCKVIFCDFFDTIVHRTVHPNYVLRLWAKYMIRELGLAMTIDELYFIRKESENYLKLHLGKKHVIKIGYEKVIKEVFTRLVCTNKLKGTTIEEFSELFEWAEYTSEIKVQFLNPTAISELRALKNYGCKIYCVSDFYTSARVIERIMEHHQIRDVFLDVFVSSELNASKHFGSIYPIVLKKLDLLPQDLLMIGDNVQSDQINAELHGLHSLLIPNKKYSKTNFKSTLGSDKKDYRNIVTELRKACNLKNAPSNSDYILFYTVYIERLYKKAKADGIKDIMFLAREGLYLKKLFDYYQESINLPEKNRIKSHYLRTSRQAAMLVSLQEIDKEEFPFLRKKYPDLSVYAFLKNFDFDEEIIESIIKDLDLGKEARTKISNFLDSDIYHKVLKSELFLKRYEEKRIQQKNAFNAYLDSFNIDFKKDGMHLADIGWGGSMQERLYDYFNGEVKVFGYYLGLREVYTIQEGTKRFGLNFNVYPYATSADEILRGNIELNEQLLSAPHGSAVSYDVSLENFTKQYHNKDEKRIYDEVIKDIQDFMFVKFKDLLSSLETICYDDELVQQEMTDYALRIGIFAYKRKIACAMKLSEGFYTNVGDFSQGLTIGTNKKTSDFLKETKTIIFAPEKLFRYILRVKPYFYSRNKYFLAYFFPSFLIYKYIRFSLWFRKKVLGNFTYLKYAYLK